MIVQHQSFRKVRFSFRTLLQRPAWDRCRPFSATRQNRQDGMPKTEPLEEIQDVDSEGAFMEAVQPHFIKQQPLLIRNALSLSNKNVSAMEHFRDWTYLKQRVDGSTDCHIEIGGNYSQSQIADVPFAEFLTFMQFFEERYGRRPEETKESDDGAPSQEELMYLAQNDIFPELLEEIDVPQFCSELGEGKLYNTMIWIGPYGCLSPLHYDPLDNVLMQFVGQKKAYLCAPTAQVHAGAEGNQHNTSPLNPDKEITNEIAQKYPSIRDITFLEATLNAGDALFVPKKWYHHVRTIETSVSVNTWFR